MISPFPGMDPFIEGCGLWEDFHSHLIEAMAETLSTQVPERYLVRTGERAYVVLAESGEKGEHLFKPDVGISSPQAVEFPQGKIAVAEPETESIVMRAFLSEEFRESFIEIYALNPTRHLVTCLEVLSPSNKRPETLGWEIYLRKRQGMMLGEANLVELDLLRGGQKFPMLDPWPKCPYTILVSRRAQTPLCRVWQAHFMRPLPPFLVPLAHPDPDIILNIQPMVEAIYRRYRYDQDIDYSQELSPSLSPEEKSWLSDRVKN